MVLCAGQGDLVSQLREAMKGRLIQMEEALFIASGQRFEPESEAAAEALFLSGAHLPPLFLALITWNLLK